MSDLWGVYCKYSGDRLATLYKDDTLLCNYVATSYSVKRIASLKVIALKGITGAKDQAQLVTVWLVSRVVMLLTGFRSLGVSGLVCQGMQ